MSRREKTSCPPFVMFKAPSHVTPAAAAAATAWGSHNYPGPFDSLTMHPTQKRRSPKNAVNQTVTKREQKRQRRLSSQISNTPTGGESSQRSHTQQKHQQSMCHAPVKRRRTADDFLLFCKMVLDYENYSEAMKLQEEETRKRHSSSPLGSTGSSAGSWTSSNSSIGVSAGNIITKDELSDEPASVVLAVQESDKVEKAEVGSEAVPEDGWEQVTCYCNKPYNGHPMVECTACFTWIHLKCARLKRNRKVPEDWRCIRCRSNPMTKDSLVSEDVPTLSKVSGSRKRKSSNSKRHGAEETKEAVTQNSSIKSRESEEPVSVTDGRSKGWDV